MSTPESFAATAALRSRAAAGQPTPRAGIQTWNVGDEHSVSARPTHSEVMHCALRLARDWRVPFVYFVGTAEGWYG
jgi:hypothetical protein